jgi:GNAT superfamily N-acetyltransferase
MGRILVAAAVIGAALFMHSEAAGYPQAARRLPQILGIVAVLLAVLTIVQALVGIRRVRAERAVPLVVAPDWRQVGIGFAFVALVVGYAWSIPRVGYLVATPLMLLLPLLALRPVGRRGMVVTVVAVTGAIWLIFLWFLDLPIPLYPGA